MDRITSKAKTKPLDRGLHPAAMTTGLTSLFYLLLADKTFWIAAQMMSVYKFRHSGLFFSINASFHTRFHFFTLFSLMMALSIVS